MPNRKPSTFFMTMAWVALALALGWSADVVEDLVFETVEASDGEDTTHEIEYDDVMIPMARMAVPISNDRSLSLLSQNPITSAPVPPSLVPIIMRSTRTSSVRDSRQAYLSSLAPLRL
jgi:hypothetical protein